MGERVNGGGVGKEDVYRSKKEKLVLTLFSELYSNDKSQAEKRLC